MTPSVNSRPAANGTLIVTGGGRGIGAAVAKAAAKHGFSVAVNYSRDAAGAMRVVEDITNASSAHLAPIFSDRCVSAPPGVTAGCGPGTDMSRDRGGVVTGADARLESSDLHSTTVSGRLPETEVPNSKGISSPVVPVDSGPAAPAASQVGQPR